VHEPASDDDDDDAVDYHFGDIKKEAQSYQLKKT
jgi:hypothetical protein